MDGADLFEHCVAQATLVIKQVRPEHFSNPTPDHEWDVAELSHAMVRALNNVSDCLQDDLVTEAHEMYEDELPEDDDFDLSTEWQAAVDNTELTIGEMDLDELLKIDGLEMSVDDYLRREAGKMLVYAWDLGTAIGMTIHFDNEVASEIYETALHDRRSRKKSALLANALQVPESADLQTKLLALFGRRPDWKAALGRG